MYFCWLVCWPVGWSVCYNFLKWKRSYPHKATLLLEHLFFSLSITKNLRICGSISIKYIIYVYFFYFFHNFSLIWDAKCCIQITFSLCNSVRALVVSLPNNNNTNYKPFPFDFFSPLLL